MVDESLGYFTIGGLTSEGRSKFSPSDCDDIGRSLSFLYKLASYAVQCGFPTSDINVIAELTQLHHPIDATAQTADKLAQYFADWVKSHNPTLGKDFYEQGERDLRSGLSEISQAKEPEDTGEDYRAFIDTQRFSLVIPKVGWAELQPKVLRAAITGDPLALVIFGDSLSVASVSTSSSTPRRDVSPMQHYCYWRAACANHPDALHRLAAMHSFLTDGFERIWLINALKVGHPCALYDLGLTTYQVARAGRETDTLDKISSDWLLDAANSGHPGATTARARLLRRKLEWEEIIAKTTVHSRPDDRVPLTELANKGNISACHQLAHDAWIASRVRLRHPNAALEMGAESELEWKRKAAQSGDEELAVELEKDQQKRTTMLQTASAAGQGWASLMLASPEIAEPWRYLLLAYEQGPPPFTPPRAFYRQIISGWARQFYPRTEKKRGPCVCHPEDR